MQRQLLLRRRATIFCVVVAAGVSQGAAQTQLPEAPAPATEPATRTLLSGATRPAKTIAMVNGRPYVKPTAKEQFRYYVRDTYWWPAMARSTARALYGFARGKPEGWGQDWPGFGQRMGSATATTVINGNVRYGMEMLFKEDMRYIPCHGCSAKRKIGNAVLSEITARHNSDGHRFFTLTPIVSDFSGPLVGHAFWYPPGSDSVLDGLIATRVVLVTRIGGHLFTEFVMERRHHDPPYEDPQPKVSAPSQPPSSLH